MHRLSKDVAALRTDIAPIFKTISALTESGPVVSITRPPSTAGTTRSRSTIAAKLSSIAFAVEKE